MMLSPLTDITNVMTPVQAVKPKPATANIFQQKATAPVNEAPKTVKKVIRHDPYNWNCLCDEPAEESGTISPAAGVAAEDVLTERSGIPAAVPTEPSMSNALVQFKCRQLEFSSLINIEKGQYVVVQGDRGIDIGVVIRVNTENNKTYVERTGPVGNILRHATQEEVNFWATELKDAEAAAVEYCQAQVRRHGFEMSIVHAEYQFDKKKLTFYYESRQRIDFVQMLKELYREFGCRIWMEKVHIHE